MLLESIFLPNTICSILFFYILGSSNEWKVYTDPHCCVWLWSRESSAVTSKANRRFRLGIWYSCSMPHNFLNYFENYLDSLPAMEPYSAIYRKKHMISNIKHFRKWLNTTSKIEKEPRGIQGEKSRKDTASSVQLVSTIGA